MQKREEMNRYKKETLLPKSFFEKVNIPKAKHRLRQLLNSAIIKMQCLITILINNRMMYAHH